MTQTKLVPKWIDPVELPALVADAPVLTEFGQEHVTQIVAAVHGYTAYGRAIVLATYVNVRGTVWSIAHQLESPIAILVPAPDYEAETDEWLDDVRRHFNSQPLHNIGSYGYHLLDEVRSALDAERAAR